MAALINYEQHLQQNNIRIQKQVIINLLRQVLDKSQSNSHYKSFTLEFQPAPRYEFKYHTHSRENRKVQAIRPFDKDSNYIPPRPHHCHSTTNYVSEAAYSGTVRTNKIDQILYVEALYQRSTNTITNRPVYHLLGLSINHHRPYVQDLNRYLQHVTSGLIDPTQEPPPLHRQLFMNQPGTIFNGQFNNQHH
jgi:hypothetical protein